MQNLPSSGFQGCASLWSAISDASSQKRDHLESESASKVLQNADRGNVSTKVVATTALRNITKDTVNEIFQECSSRSLVSSKSVHQERSEDNGKNAFCQPQASISRHPVFSTDDDLDDIIAHL